MVHPLGSQSEAGGKHVELGACSTGQVMMTPSRCRVLTRNKNQKVAGVPPWKTTALKDFTKEKGPAREMRWRWEGTWRGLCQESLGAVVERELSES